MYPLQFDFGRLYSTFHALISVTEQIGENVDKGNRYRLWYFCWFAESVDTVEHGILLALLEHYGRHSISNEWYKSFLFVRKQFVSSNGRISNTASVKYGIPQGSVFGPILLLIYINDLNQAIKICKIHHFADNTNLVHFSNSIKLNL